MSLSNSPSSRGGCAEPAGENWVSTGLGARGQPCFPGSWARERGPSLRAAGVRCGVDTPRAPGVPGWHRSHLPQKGDPFPLSPAAGDPRAGYRPVPRFILGPRMCRGGQSRARVECTTAGAGVRTPQPPPSSTPALLPGRDLSSWGAPSFPILSPRGRSGRCVPTGIGAGGCCFPAVAAAAGAGEAPRQEASLVTGRLSAGCSSFLPWSRGLCGLRVMRWKAPESLER